MEYTATIIATGKKAEEIDKIIKKEPDCEKDCFGEDEKYTVNVTFENGYTAYIDLCGVQYVEGKSNLPWTQGMLYDDNNRQVCCTEPDEEFFGDWYFEDNIGNTYNVTVRKASTVDLE